MKSSVVGLGLLLAAFAAAEVEILGQIVQRGEPDQAAVEKLMSAFNEPCRIAESNPVTVNKARFTVVAQTDWRRAKPDPFLPMVSPIEIQLCVTNLSDNDTLFPTSKAFGIKIFDADGKEVIAREIAKPTVVTGPILLGGGASYSISRRADLSWDEQIKAGQLVYHDGTGSRTAFGPLAPGRYKLVSWYAVSVDGREKRKQAGLDPWVGDVVTNGVFVDVLESATLGVDRSSSVSREFKEPLRIRESKPVVLNDATFVVAAQAEWKPDKLSAVVPIEIQLRIVNGGKSDRVFPTFDTFALKLSTEDGKRIMPYGGRKGTRFTRPILLPPGTSYSVCREYTSNNTHRRAELHWDAKSNASKLVYCDGTGFTKYYGPLTPGRYKLAFLYEVSPRGPFQTTRNSATWIGAAVTDEVIVEIFNP